MMDRSLWISWYDLADANRDAYLKWLHEDYLPRLLKNPRVLHAAHYRNDRTQKPLPVLRHTKEPLPAGNDYILIIGAEDAHVLADFTPYRTRGSVSPQDKKMLAMRVGERQNLFTEECRIDGPEAARREGRHTLGAGIQLGNFDAGSWEDEDELLSWYAHFRLPHGTTMPSCIGIRKMVSVSGWAKHGVLYEFTSLEDRNRNFRAHEHKDPKEAAWTEEVIKKLVHAPGSPAVAARIWPPVG